jgi:hypothetical protein
VGFDCVHAAIPPGSRRGPPDETTAACAAFPHRPARFFAARGIARIEHEMTDDALACTRSHAWRQALTELGAPGPTHPPLPPPDQRQSIERFNRTMLDELAYQRPYTSNTERTTALAGCATAHTAIGGQPPISRVNNPAGSYS